MSTTKTLIEATPEEIVSRVAAANESIIRKVVNEQNRPEPFIGVPEAANIFAVSQANNRKKCTENLIPHYQEFEKSPIRFKASELYQYIEKGYVKTSVEVRKEAKDFVNSKK